ncbi:hypothetical protein NMY22_g3351 [Coprinellus aureogranulatus]|nr:hypothetical protein NMY22_g3351 [Coprinellus aureogranulatus]
MTSAIATIHSIPSQISFGSSDSSVNPSPEARRAFEATTHSAPLISVPLLPSYPLVVYAIRKFNKDRKDYAYYPDDEEVQKRWSDSCNLMQSILDRYHDLTPHCRDVIDICLDVWSMLDIFVTVLPDNPE